METEREKLPDILRGFAIILVVLGHCIQEGSGESFSANSLYFYDKLYQLIYSFHMPLFMMISGYLSWGSMQRADTKEKRRGLLRRRVITLLSPIFLWTAIDYVGILITIHIRGEAQPEAIIFVYFYNALNNFWFLWAVFWCFLIVYVMYYFFENSIVLYLLGFAALFFMPDGLGLGAYKYMLPYFVASFYGHKYIEKQGKFARSLIKPWIVAALGVVFAVMFLFFDEKAFIYLTGYKLIGKLVIEQLAIDLYRTTIGFVGSIFFIILWYCISEHFLLEYRFLTALGTNSMGIYILSGYLIVLVVRRFTFTGRPPYIINLLEMVVVLLAAWGLTRLFGRVRGLRLLVGKYEGGKYV